ncbi:hypothetical protein AtNW77_Chr3g0195611 [Arabidopsis thaliana]
MCLISCFVRTLLKDHGFICWKKIGIMLPPLCSGEYQCLSNPFCPLVVCLRYLKDFYLITHLKLMFEFPIRRYTDYKLCVEFLNLHDLCGFHVREDPPVLLRFTRTLNLYIDLCFSHNVNYHVLCTNSTNCGLSMLITNPTTMTAFNLIQQHHLRSSKPCQSRFWCSPPRAGEIPDFDAFFEVKLSIDHGYLVLQCFTLGRFIANS